MTQLIITRTTATLFIFEWLLAAVAFGMWKRSYYAGATLFLAGFAIFLLVAKVQP